MDRRDKEQERASCEGKRRGPARVRGKNKILCGFTQEKRIEAEESSDKGANTIGDREGSRQERG